MKNIQKSTMESFTEALNLSLALQKPVPKDSWKRPTVFGHRLEKANWKGLEKARDQEIKTGIDRRLSLSARAEQTHQCAIWNPHGTDSQKGWDGP